MTALYVIVPDDTPAVDMWSSTESAARHWPAFPQASMAALKLTFKRWCSKRGDGIYDKNKLPTHTLCPRHLAVTTVLRRAVHALQYSRRALDVPQKIKQGDVFCLRGLTCCDRYKIQDDTIRQ